VKWGERDTVNGNSSRSFEQPFQGFGESRQVFGPGIEEEQPAEPRMESNGGSSP